AMSEVEPTTSPDLGTMRRALRELEAAKARVERDAQRAADDLRENLVIELLPVLDNFDRTIHAAEEGGASSQAAGVHVASALGAMLQGVRLVRSQFAGVLAKYGVERIDAKHQRFDPRIHDAISIVPVRHAEAHDVVIDQIEAGYRFGDRLIRPAKVIVGRYMPRWH
ncbi:MAG TPA: nucleotide exchange factor GrpE, partial [Kofleriaceae bacterium]